MVGKKGSCIGWGLVTCGGVCEKKTVQGEAILKCNFNNISAFIFFFFSFLKTLYNSFKMGLSLEKNALNRTMVYFALNLGLL